MRLTRSIFAILLIAIGSALFTLSLWTLITSPHLAFLAFIYGVGGLVTAYIGWLLRKSTSLKNFIRIILSSGLIVFGIGIVVFALWMQIWSSQLIEPLGLGLIGLAVGAIGWLLRPSKLSLIRNIYSGALITSGVGLFICPLWLFFIYGSNIAFANIAMSYFIAGLLFGLFGVSVRNKKQSQ